MKPLVPHIRRITIIVGLGWLAPGAGPASAQTNDIIRIIEVRGAVEVLPRGAANWVATQTNQVLYPADRVRTHANSSVGLLLSDRSVLRFDAMSELEILPETRSEGQGLHLIDGLFSFFHRGQPGRINVIAGGARAGVEGTEFALAVIGTNGLQSTTLSVIDGRVRFENAGAGLILTNGEQAMAASGTPPRRTAGFNATNLLQWCFYYPAVINPDELELTAAEQSALAPSLAAYRSGDVLAALAGYLPGRAPGSDGERIYLAALLLSAGQVAPAEAQLARLGNNNSADRNQRLAAALQKLIAAVKRQPRPSPFNDALSSEFIASSYYVQSMGGPNALEQARELARRATTNAPAFGFAWERLAELEFSFGRINHASTDLDQALKLAPRNAEALALRGFLLAARNRPREAIGSFDQALAVDDSLANAWLGRGLCRIRQGDARAGREDLLIAAAMEPDRAALRSYLGKALGDAGDPARAMHELALAKEIDPNDPTAWLYLALLDEQHYRLNEAVRNLEESEELNDNRSVYRSSLLLDQDRAVRSANLARIYDEAGLDDVAVHEASRAESADYANYSAHLFLANSYQQLLDSSPFDLRYETPAFNEYLLASLLGPADGRLLAQPVTQQEYTELFDREGFGVSSSSEYLSRGAFSQYAAQYGTVKNTSYAVEADYDWDPGQTPNGSLQSQEFSFKMKQMLTPDDGLFFQILDFHQDTGDLSQRYNPNDADLTYKTHERQDPSLLVGLDHRWSESQRTLFLTSIYNDTLSVVDGNGPTYLLGTVGSGYPPSEFAPIGLTDSFRNRLLLDSFELQHVATFSELQLIGGLRIQNGSYDLSSRQTFLHANWLNLSLYDRFFLPDPPAAIATQSLDVDSLRVTPYLYGYWHIFKQLCLIGGVDYTYQKLPMNALFAPLDAGETTERQLSPKAGIVWTPDSRTTVRGAYSQSLGGANLDQSLRLEPTQLAGFTDAYRDIMPESLVGAIGGARFETADVAIERRFGSGTYLAAGLELLHSTACQSEGAVFGSLFGSPSLTQVGRQLSFQERSLDLSAHQLVGDYLSFGARYRLADAQLDSSFPQFPSMLRAQSASTLQGQLSLVTLDTTFQHPSGFFATFEGQWWGQQLLSDLSGIPGDHFWQFNVEAGWRSPRRHFVASVALLNITGQDYRLYPINLYPDLPRQQTLALKLQLNF